MEVRVERPLVDEDEAQPGRHHQPLLRRGDRDVDAPGVHLEAVAAERCHRVDHQERRVVGSVDGGSDGSDVVADRRGGVDVGDEHGFGAAVGVGGERRFDGVGVDRLAVRGGDDVVGDVGKAHHLRPAGGEVSGLGDEHVVAPAERVGERHLPSAVAVADGDVRAAIGAGERREAVEDVVDDADEVALVDVRERAAEGFHHAVRHDGWAGNHHERVAVSECHSLTLRASAAGSFAGSARAECVCA